MVTKEAIASEFKKRAGDIAPIGGVLKFKLDGDIITIDGSGNSNEISFDDVEADCTISTSKANFEKLRSGKLNPMTAVMFGKVKIKGDMGLAMQLQSLM